MKNEASFVATVNIFICQCSLFNGHTSTIPHRRLSAHGLSQGGLCSGDAVTRTGFLLLKKMPWWQNGESTNQLKFIMIKQKKQPQMTFLVWFNQPTLLLLPSQNSSRWTHLWNVALELHWLRMHDTANGCLICCVFFFMVCWNARVESGMPHLLAQY